MSGTYKSTFSGERYAFPLKFSYVRVELSFDEPVQKNARRSGNFSGQCPKLRKDPSEVWFGSEFSSGLVEGSFNNSTDIFSTNRQKFVNQYPKKIRFFFRKKPACLKKFSWTRKKHSFKRLVRKFSTKAEVFFPWISKTEKNILFRKRFASQCSYGRKESSFDQSTENSFTKSDKFLLNVRKWWNFFFSKPVVSTKCFFGHVESSFDKPLGIFSTIAGKVLLIGRQW